MPHEHMGSQRAYARARAWGRGHVGATMRPARHENRSGPKLEDGQFPGATCPKLSAPSVRKVCPGEALGCGDRGTRGVGWRDHAYTPMPMQAQRSESGGNPILGSSRPMSFGPNLVSRQTRSEPIGSGVQEISQTRSDRRRCNRRSLAPARERPLAVATAQDRARPQRGRDGGERGGEREGKNEDEADIDDG